jgi:hypothetical protein
MMKYHESKQNRDVGFITVELQYRTRLRRSSRKRRLMFEPPQTVVAWFQ